MRTLFRSNRRAFQESPIPWHERMSRRQLFAGLATVGAAFWILLGATAWAAWEFWKATR
jgi:hypothetical protein